MLKIRKLGGIDFLIKQFVIWFNCIALVETCCWDVDMFKSESSQMMKAVHNRQIPGTFTTSSQFSTTQRENHYLRNFSEMF